MTPRPSPTFDLAEVQEAACRGAGRLVISPKVLHTASQALCDPDDIQACLAALTTAEFHKTMPSDKRPGRMQDAYKTHYCGFAIYIKFDYYSETRTVVLLSFKLDEDPR